MPAEGVPKDGTPQSRVGARMKAAGEAVGIAFTGLCDRYPNSLGAHALLQYAAEVAPAKQNELQEVLFRQYFTDGVCPMGASLAAAAAEVGLDGEAARKYAEAEANQRAVATHAREISRSGVTGVPFFYVNGKPAFSGAQSPSAFLQVIEEAARG
ncbi:hypothetical protein AB1Y20_013019 [Prymnesium parvum]|uniref:DSBA-like thioredoxin domain-containing protein n=1 Tax=Prymnesium parvum TaxID=97485 RepID=A0AB34IMC8_PRYPA|mmetsp:Transcript_45518/g.113139  ORF Transcript_45518/g.113139 Transcript_45518/m.113139 type:complete len:155 (-) Transcript_45518:343-807(-)